MANEFYLQGLDGVLEKLRTLSPKLQKKGLVTAMRKGANIVRDDARRRARVFDDESTGSQIWREIVTKQNARRGRREGGVAMRVGVRGGAADKGNRNHPFWWRFLEFGTSKMAARPFMRPALETNVDKATDAIVTELRRQLDEVL